MSTSTVTARTKNWSQRYEAQFGQVPIVNTAPVGSVSGGSETGRGPFQTKAMFSMMNETPIAVIRGTSRGAPRNGLYATRSIVALRSAQPIMAAASEMRMTGMSVESAGFDPRSNTWITNVAVIIP